MKTSMSFVLALVLSINLSTSLLAQGNLPAPASPIPQNIQRCIKLMLALTNSIETQLHFADTAAMNLIISSLGDDNAIVQANKDGDTSLAATKKSNVIRRLLEKENCVSKEIDQQIEREIQSNIPLEKVDNVDFDTLPALITGEQRDH